MKIMLHRFLLVTLSTVFLSGCIDWVDDTSDLKRFVADQNNQPASQIEPLPEFKPYHGFVYEGASMREPFVPLIPIITVQDQEIELEETSKIKPNENREKEYLETFALDALTMVGTIEMKGGELWALVKDSNAELHRVTVGNFLGLDHGEITSLDERNVHLSEIISNGRGGWLKRPRSIALVEQE